jgi:hypothetical protein
MQEGTGLLGGKVPASTLYQHMIGMGPEYAKLGMAGLGVGQQKDRGEYFVPVQTADGVKAFDSRRGTIVDPSGGQVIGSSSDPRLQGRISRAREYGKGEAEIDVQSNIKKPQQARDTLSILSEADDLIEKSTGSYIGTGADFAARTVGVATPGAQANAKLRVLQAGLMTNMPRMEGPQSDRDVQLYREAAGQIGDSTIPNEIKKAAVSTIRGINEKYAARAPGKTQQTKVRRYNPATGRIE